MQQSKKYKVKASNFAFSKVNSNSVKYFKNSDTTKKIKKRTVVYNTISMK